MVDLEELSEGVLEVLIGVGTNKPIVDKNEITCNWGKPDKLRSQSKITTKPWVPRTELIWPKQHLGNQAKDNLHELVWQLL